ncbi:hypothetical protein AGLY_013901 [Aphis glycines]|uniref:Uncharacterized protein n=1 Tax=Aphis glycines TaxID=307491 RepID=A0A6G0T5R6_APHGL|nr:hypothetical protein AGLY_013901 [Aphis glycines]
MLIKKNCAYVFLYFLITIRITYEELCIKFSTQKSQNILKIKSRKENDNLNNCIYDLYYLNNNKYQKSFEIFEEKFMENLVTNFQNLVIKEKNFTIFQPQNYLQIFAILTYFKNLKFQLSINCSKKNPKFFENLTVYGERKIYGEPCNKFSKLSYKRKKFYDFPTTKLLANFCNFDIFRINSNFKNLQKKLTTYKKPCIKFSRFSGQPKNFYRYLKKKYLEKFKISIVYKLFKKKPKIL